MLLNEYKKEGGKKMIIKNFKLFEGQHCETTAAGNLLSNLGINLSEPMFFGLGEGLNFIIWNMKTMDFPFIGGRIKTDLLTQNITRHLNLKLNVWETSSPKKAWKNVKESIDAEIPVGIKLDCYHLDYFTNKFYFAGHYVAMYGYDENNVYLADTIQQGGLVEASLKNFALVGLCALLTWAAFGAIINQYLHNVKLRIILNSILSLLLAYTAVRISGIIS